MVTHPKPARQVPLLMNPITGVVSDWRTRALELAIAHGLANTGRGLSTQYDADCMPSVTLVRVASQSHTERHYDVVYEAVNDSAQCACTAASYGRPCAHAGEAIRYGRYVSALHSPAARAEAERMARLDAAHEGTAVALGYSPAK